MVMVGSHNGTGRAVSGPPPSDTGSTETSELLARCRHGDETAWQELVSRYERLVFGAALREGLDLPDAADVTQTVFEALLTSLATLRDEDRLPVWLLTVARRHAWRVRDRRTRESPSATQDGADWAPLLGAAEDPADGVDRALWLHEALQRLGEPCRDLLLALYFDPAQPSYAEIALRLGRPLGSIGPSRARCLQRLRTLLTSEDHYSHQGTSQ
jgi:RNA polymerase sigma factor (sigma-70 family)